MSIRPINPDEESTWNELMASSHPLGNPQVAGHRVKYVLEKKGKWLALMCFSACAYHLADRDRWIGWNSEQATQRRHFIVQNSRFLILPHEGDHRHNLASHTLALSARRISNDWQERFGYPVLLLETFVDPAYFRGTSYKAAGWIIAGQTQGFRRDSKDFYCDDSTPKDIWLRPLRSDAREILQADKLPKDLAKFEKELPAKQVMNRLGFKGLDSLFTVLKQLPDPRRRQGRRYSIRFCMAVLTCAILAGCKGLRECEEFGKSLSQPQLRRLRAWRNPKTGKYETPNHCTLWKIATIVDVELFEQLLNKWMKDEDISLEAIALDGKTLRGTLLNEDGGSCVVSAMSHNGAPLFSTRHLRNQKVKK